MLIVSVVVMCDLCISNSAHNYNWVLFMTKDNFLQLQELQRNSGLPLIKYLREKDLSYSTYNYWKRKFLCQENEESVVLLLPRFVFAPIPKLSCLLLQVTLSCASPMVLMFDLMPVWKKVLPD